MLSSMRKLMLLGTGSCRSRSYSHFSWRGTGVLNDTLADEDAGSLVNTAVGSVEAALAIHHGISVSLSRKELLQRDFNSSGDLDLAFDYMSRFGIGVEKDLQQCGIRSVFLARADRVISEAAMEKVLKIQPLAVSVCAGQEYVEHEMGTIFETDLCHYIKSRDEKEFSHPISNPNHVALLTDHGSRDEKDFSRPIPYGNHVALLTGHGAKQGKEYWEIQTFRSNFGCKGVMHIRKNIGKLDGQCFIETNVFVPIIETDSWGVPYCPEADYVVETGTVEVEYIESENLNDVEDIDSCLKTLLTGLNSKDWVLVCDTLNNVRRLSIFHKEAMLDILEDVVTHIAKVLKSPRGAVIKTAIMTSADIFCAYNDLIIDSLDPLLVQLLLKSSQDKRFVCEAAEKALIIMTTWISPVSLLPKLQPYIKHMNPRIRAKATMCISQCVSRMSAEGIKTYGKDKLTAVVASQLFDELPESREAARTILFESQDVYDRFLVPAATVSNYPETKTVSEDNKTETDSETKTIYEDPKMETASEDLETETASEDPETKTESW